MFVDILIKFVANKMDSAVLKFSSIGVLLPSFSLSNVDVNEHDCSNEILCNIDVASVTGDASKSNFSLCE